MPARDLLALTLVCALAACLDPAAAPHGGEPGPFELEAFDFRGTAVAHDRLPRRPRLELQIGAGLRAGEDDVLLFAGTLDEALLEDLAAAPLREEHRDRQIELEVTSTRSGAIVTLLRALAPDARYALVVPPWARDGHGDRITEDGTPLVFELATAGDLGAGAALVRTFPADGAVDVGTNLQAAVLAFDGRVENVEEGIWIEDPWGLAVPVEVRAEPCEGLAPALGAPFCVRLTPEGALPPAGEHALVVGDAARDGHGAPVGPAITLFRTAPGLDHEPPSLLPLGCAVDEQTLPLGCALVSDTSLELRAQSDEGVLAELGVETRVARTAALDGLLHLRLQRLPPDAAIELTLRLEDSSGNVLLEPFVLRTEAQLATLSITELRADPLGPEPAQEYVELWNYGDRAVDLLGFSLHDRDDELGEPIERSLRVEPDTRILLVPDGFDGDDALDVAPPPGAPLLHMGRSLASAGLGNQGERVYLRDPLGRRVSAAPATPKPKAGVCLERVGEDPRDGSPSAFRYADRCSPGR